MPWLTLLSNVSAFVYITADVVVLFYVLPAYRQTRQRAFVLIGFACLMGIFDTLCDHTIGRYRMATEDRVVYQTLRQFTHYATVFLETFGIVLLTQSYLRRFLTEPPSLPVDDLPR